MSDIIMKKILIINNNIMMDIILCQIFFTLFLKFIINDLKEIKIVNNEKIPNKTITDITTDWFWEIFKFESKNVIIIRIIYVTKNIKKFKSGLSSPLKNFNNKFFI